MAGFQLQGGRVGAVVRVLGRGGYQIKVEELVLWFVYWAGEDIRTDVANHKGARPCLDTGQVWCV